jgi:photosystem II stability/assembly factor-like uncharacterized protein
MYVSGHYGFYRSADGGKNFEQDNSSLPGTDVHGLGMDPKHPDTLYAYFVDHGIYRSTDAGRSWEPLSDQAGIMGPILVDPRDSETLYVSSMQGGFRESTDGGRRREDLADGRASTGHGHVYRPGSEAPGHLLRGQRPTGPQEH